LVEGAVHPFQKGTKICFPKREKRCPPPRGFVGGKRCVSGHQIFLNRDPRGVSPPRERTKAFSFEKLKKNGKEGPETQMEKICPPAHPTNDHGKPNAGVLWLGQGEK